MTSVLYSGGLNYQSGNPVRTEILAVRREVTDLRKELEIISNENMVFRKYISRILEKDENKQLFSDFNKEFMLINQKQQPPQQMQNNQGPGVATVQGGGFRR
jgi:hypothetical protein